MDPLIKDLEKDPDSVFADGFGERVLKDDFGFDQKHSIDDDNNMPESQVNFKKETESPESQDINSEQELNSNEFRRDAASLESLLDFEPDVRAESQDFSPDGSLETAYTVMENDPSQASSSTGNLEDLDAESDVIESKYYADTFGGDVYDSEQGQGNVMDISDFVDDDHPLQPSVNREFQGMKFSTRVSAVPIEQKLPEHIAFPYKDDVAEVVFQSLSVKRPTQDKSGMIILYNSHVYMDNKPKPWDLIFEVRVPFNRKVQVDLGVGIVVPSGCVLKLIPGKNLQNKFGLRMVSPEILSREDAAHPIIVEFEGISDISYIAKNQTLVGCKIVQQVNV